MIPFAVTNRNDNPEPPEKRDTSFAGDVLRLVSGTGLAQLIGLLAAPILTRLYSPEAFGTAALFTSVTGIIAVIACLRYEMAIVLPDDDSEAANLLAVCLAFSVIVAAATALLVQFTGSRILQWDNMAQLAPYLWLAPAMVLITGVFTALKYWNTRTKHFTRLSIAQITSSFTNATGSLSAGFAGHVTGGALIAAAVGGQAVGTMVLGGQIWRDNGRFIAKNVRLRRLWTAMKRHRKFPIYSSWGGLLNSTSWQLPVLMLGAFFSPAIAGFYALGFRVLQIPMHLIGSAISQVFHQRAAEAANDHSLAPLVESVLQRLIAVALFPMLMLTIIGRDLFIVIFGESWAEAGLYVQILSPWACVWFVSSPMANLFGVLGHQEQGLKIQGLIFSSRLVALSVGVVFNSASLALVLFSASGALVYGYLIILIMKYAGVRPSSVALFAAKTIQRAAPYLLASIAFVLFSRSSIQIVAATAATTAIFFWANRSQFSALINRGAV